MRMLLAVTCMALIIVLGGAHVVLVLDSVRHLVNIDFGSDDTASLQHETAATIALAELVLAAMLAWYVRLCTKWFWRLMDESQA